MADDALHHFETLIDQVSRIHRKTGNVTAAIRYCWPEWSILIGRGAPFRAIDAARHLGVSKASIDKAHHVIRREQRHQTRTTGALGPTEEQHSTSSTETTSPAVAPESHSTDERDDEGNIVRYRGRWKYTYIQATQSWRTEHL